MAAVTVNNTPTRHVRGDLVTRFYNISGATGTTLTPYGQTGIRFVDIQQSTSKGVASAITSFSVASDVITFTTGGGAMDSEVVAVTSRKG